MAVQALIRERLGVRRDQRFIGPALGVIPVFVVGPGGLIRILSGQDQRVALAVCLLFERGSERAVRALWDRLERAGVPSLRSHTHGRHLPHVSYAVLRSWDLAAVSAALVGVGALAPVELTFDGVGLFRRGRAWLLAAGSAELLARQERVVEALTATGAELHQHYRPGQWLPHCSVAPRAPLAKLPVLAAAVFDVLPLEARLDRVALINSATGELWPVPAHPASAVDEIGM